MEMAKAYSLIVGFLGIKVGKESTSYCTFPVAITTEAVAGSFEQKLPRAGLPEFHSPRTPTVKPYVVGVVFAEGVEEKPCIVCTVSCSFSCS